MTDFGFQISTTRAMDYDAADSGFRSRLIDAVPSYKLCIGCGACTATCTAGQLTRFNIRRVHAAFNSGRLDTLREELDKCMLCGKCVLVCPRGVNTRALIMQMRSMLCETDTTNNM